MPIVDRFIDVVPERLISFLSAAEVIVIDIRIGRSLSEPSAVEGYVSFKD